MMSDVDVSYLVSRAELGTVAAFRGFDRNDLWTLEHDWGFLVEAHAGPCDGTYLVEREAWSEQAALARWEPRHPPRGPREWRQGRRTRWSGPAGWRGWLPGALMRVSRSTPVVAISSPETS